MDFIEIVDRIFINKDRYNEVSDEDKIASFFKINRKFGKQFPEIANKFNHKSVDKASAIDMWFEHFKNVHRIPQWYWDNKKNKIQKNKKIIKNFNLTQKKYNLNDNDIMYIEKYYLEDLKKEESKLEKYDI